MDKKGIFAGASAANQSRLHQGFHYPRCAVTRRCSQFQRKRFIDQYGFCLTAIPQKIYAVANESPLDFDSYLASVRSGDPGEHSVMFGGLNDLGWTSAEFAGLQNVQGAVRVDEPLIMQDIAANYFRHKLRSIFQIADVDLALLRSMQANFDLIIDCTYAAFCDEGVECYEPCVLWMMEGDPTWSVTIMDGPFGSVMPNYAATGGVTMTTVENTPIEQVNSYKEAQVIVEGFAQDPGWRARNFQKHCEVMRRYIVDFDKRYQYRDEFRLGIRAKPVGPADTRQMLATVEDNIIHIRPGKIDAIYLAEDFVFDQIEKMK
jgi:hypothetical protein